MFDIKEFKAMPKKIDVASWNYGMVELTNKPIGHPTNSHIVGIDPGTICKHKLNLSAFSQR